ncbi:MAG: hypothetical protein ACETWG_04640, partial [Candidatus Neomarinimicrobiota bacterium]
MIQLTHPQLVLLLVPWLVLMGWSLWRQERAARRLKRLGESRVQWYVLGRVRFPRQRAKSGL